MKREIKATKMFLPVVIVYFLTNIGPMVNYAIIHYSKKAIREVFQLVFISMALNLAANLPIYYWSSSIFKAEFKDLIQAIWPFGQNLNAHDNKDKTSDLESSLSNSNRKYS